MSKSEQVGTRFPFINLEKALLRAEQLYEADPRGRPLAVPTAFAAWGYSDKSSGGHQTVAALKLYGLISVSGANSERRIGLTPAALHYFADEREFERKKALQRFALAPKLIAAVWRDWDASTPPDNVARSQLKIDRKLNEQSARSFLSIYKDNLAFADLRHGGPHPREPDEAVDLPENDEPIIPVIGDYIQWSPNGVDQFRDATRVRGVSSNGEWVFVDGSETGIPVSEISIVRKEEIQRQIPVSQLPLRVSAPPVLPLTSLSPDVKRDVFSLEEGEVTITFPATLSRESYNDFVDWLDLVKRKAERAIKER